MKMEPSNKQAVLSEEEVQKAILQHLNTHNTIPNTLDFAESLGISHADLDKNLKSLNADEYISLQVIEKKLLELSEEGKSYVEKGTPEYQYASALEMKTPTPKAEVEDKLGKELAKIGFAKAMKNKWIALAGGSKDVVERIAEKLDDQDRELLQKYKDNTDLEAHDKKIVDQMKKRQLLNVVSQKSYVVTKGANFMPER